MKRSWIENMPAGHEMNKLVTEQIMHRYGPYSTKISAAWAIVEKLTNEGWCLGLINDDNGHWALSSEGMQNIPDKGEDTCTSFIVPATLWADTAPLAICRAALLAVMKLEAE